MQAWSLIVVLMVACGGEKPQAPERAALDKYVNVDMNAGWGLLFHGQRPFKTLPPDAFDKGLHGWFEGSMGELVIPRMTQFLDAAAKVTPPDAMKPSHATIVELATAYRDIGKDMREAASSKDTARYRAAHARMLETYERYLRWQRDLDRRLASHDLAFKAPPQPPPLAEPAPEEAHPCGGLAACELEAAVEIQGIKCGPGGATFSPEGKLLGCILATERGIGVPLAPGPFTRHANGDLHTGTSSAIFAAYDQIVCGDGPLRMFPGNKVEACTVVGDATLATVAIPKRARAEVVFHAGGAPRYVKHDGKEWCFDPSGAPVQPCTAPTWP